MRVLHVRLPCRKIFPCGTVYLVDHLRRLGAEQRVLDLALVRRPRRKERLLKEIEAFEPEIVAFSWRDIQIFSPDHMDPSLENAFKFYYHPNPFVKASAALRGVASILDYKSRIKENLDYINFVSRLMGPKVVVGGPAPSVFPEHIAWRLDP
jgi:hypothetical protein